MATPLATAVDREQEVQHQLAQLGTEMQARQKEQAEVERAIAAAGPGTDSEELARLLGRREALDLLLHQLRRRRQELTALFGRARANKTAEEQRLRALRAVLEAAEGQVVRWRQLVADAETELSARKRQLTLAEQKVLELGQQIQQMGG